MERANQQNTNELFEAFFASLGLSPNQKKELLLHLEKAIAVNLASRLLQQLSDEDKARFQSCEFTESEQITKFFSESIPQNIIEKARAAAVEEIMTNYLEKFK